MVHFRPNSPSDFPPAGGGWSDGAGSHGGQPHQPGQPGQPGQPWPTRLNLLISYAAWHRDSWADALPRLLEPMGVKATRVNTAKQAERFIRSHPVHIAVVDLGLPMDEMSTQPPSDLLSTEPPFYVGAIPVPSQRPEDELSPNANIMAQMAQMDQMDQMDHLAQQATDPVAHKMANQMANQMTGQQEAGARVLDLLARLHSPPPTVVVRPPRQHRDGCRDMNAALRCGAFAVVDRTAADLELMLDVMKRCLTRFYAGRWPTSP